MRSRILGIKTSDGWFRLKKVFPPTKNDDGTTSSDENLSVTHIEYVEQVDGDGDVYGFYRIWGADSEDGELSKNNVAVVYAVSIDQVKRVIELVPAEDLKTRWDAFEATLGSEFRELSSDLPREKLLAHKARIEKRLSELDENEKEGEQQEPSTEPTVASTEEEEDDTKEGGSPVKPVQ